MSFDDNSPLEEINPEKDIEMIDESGLQTDSSDDFPPAPPTSERVSLLESGSINRANFMKKNAIRSRASENSNTFVYLITFFAAVGGFLFGYDTGVISGAILFIKDDFNLTKFEQELVISIALLGAMIGSFIGGPASDKYGRRPIIMVASMLFVAGSAMLSAAPNLEVLVVGRFIVGTGIGVAANIVPVFVAEVSPAEKRGSLVTVINLCITSGQFISYLVDSAFVPVPQGWRYMLGLAALPALIQWVGMFQWVPESPRWLVSQRKVEEARVILKKIRGTQDDEAIEMEMQEIQQSLQQENGGWRELLSPAVRPALYLGMFCGINTAMYYSPTILKMAGFKSNSEAIWFADGVAFTNAVFTVLALYLIDRIGRRKLLINTMFGMVFGLIALGMSFFLSQFTGGYTGYAAVGSLVIYVAFFATGMGPIPWAVNAEIYPLSIRGLANGVATSVNWASNLVVSITFLTYIDLVGEAAAFWTYAGIGVVAIVYFFFKLPETKGKTIEEIQDYFRVSRM